MPARGECECGSVRYWITGPDPLYVYACHCLNCQTRSGSAFAQHAMVRIATFSCEGETEGYRRTAHGIEFEEIFCGACHTRIFNRNSALPDTIFLRAGTLSESQALEPVAHIWARRKQAWLVLPEGVPIFEESPSPVQFDDVIREAQAHQRA